MARLAKQFNKALHKHHQTYAAWWPVTNTIQVGDFGYIEGGVFRSLGNIRDLFEVEFETKEGPPSKIDFTSEGTVVTKFVAGAEVPSFPPVGNLEAKLNFGFNRSNAFAVKANLTSVEMANKQKVAWELAKSPRWKSKYKIVDTTYTGKDALVILSASGGFNFGISGSVDALKALNGGSANGEYTFENSNQADFNSVGDTGVIALRLFKINRKGDVSFLKELKEEDVEVQQFDSDELEDDL